MDLFAIGEIVKTRGLRGCLKVFSYAGTQKNFAGLKFIYIEKPAGQKNHYNIRKIDVSGKFLFIELEGIDDVESAGRFVGCKIFVPKELFQKSGQRMNITGRILSGLMFLARKGSIWDG